MQSFRNLQAVKRQQVEEFARRLIFSISQAAVAVSEKSSLHTNYFKCHKTHFRSIAGEHKTDRIWTERELLLQSEGSSLKGENSGNKFEVNSRR